MEDLSLDLQPVSWSSVNRWECDENDHLNVRFYAAKMNAALQLALMDMHLDPIVIRQQHMRYLAEARVATPLRIDAALVKRADDRPALLLVMRNLAFDRVLATYTTTLPSALNLSPLPPLPEFAARRGLTGKYLTPSPEEAETLGYVSIGRGIVQPAECDSDGCLLPELYIGRISDGMPNLWSLINGAEDAEAHERGDQGGAVLEYELDILDPLRVGHAFRHLCAITEIGNKTMTVTHLIVDETTGKPAATARALAIAMDLETRTSAAISAPRRARMLDLLIESPNH